MQRLDVVVLIVKKKVTIDVLTLKSVTIQHLWRVSVSVDAMIIFTAWNTFTKNCVMQFGKMSLSTSVIAEQC